MTALLPNTRGGGRILLSAPKKKWGQQACPLFFAAVQTRNSRHYILEIRPPTYQFCSNRPAHC